MKTKTKKMKRTTAMALVAAALATQVSGGEMETSKVITHPSQGDKMEVAGATARMIRHEDGVFVNFDTSGLTPGNVHTLWFVNINDPASCETQPCTAKDVLKRTDAVSADVGYAGGVVVGADGTASFNWHQSEGALSGGWFTAGLIEADNSEIHLVVNDHGPVLEGRVDQMLATYRDGCTDESIPGPMPATARAQGEAGPNACRLMQFAIFQPSAPES